MDADPYTFVAADPLVLKVREGGRVMSVHALLAAGVNADGHREILGLQVTSAEDGAGWLGFFRDLTARGLTGVRLVTVLAPGTGQPQGWVTGHDVLQALTRTVTTTETTAARAAAPAGDDHGALPGYQLVEVTIGAGAPAAGRRLGDTAWPPGWVPVSVHGARALRDAEPGLRLQPGDRVSLLAPRPPAPPGPAGPAPQAQGHAERGRPWPGGPAARELVQPPPGAGFTHGVVLPVDGGRAAVWNPLIAADAAVLLTLCSCHHGYLTA